MLSKGATLKLDNATAYKINSSGTVINVGNSYVNDYSQEKDSTLYTDVSGTLKTENADIKGNIILTNENDTYFSKNGTDISIVSGNKINNNATIKMENKTLKNEINNLDDSVNVKVSRVDVKEYATNNNFTEQQVNTA